jgi:hypothetical protein
MKFSKSLQIVAITIVCGAITAAAQTTAPAPDASSSNNSGEARELRQKLEAMTPQERETFLQNHPEIRKRIEARRQEMLGKYSQMSPAQQQQFLLNHPQLQQFIQNHPQAVAKAEANASEAKPGVVDPNHPRVNEVNQREQNQQQRINQGIASGSLTPEEQAKLAKGENKIQAQETADMNKNNGHLTPAETRKLNREQNRESSRIHRLKHNGQTVTTGTN